jgi:hypothetical protein
MTSRSPLIAISQEAVTRISTSSAQGGDLKFLHTTVDDVYVVSSVETTSGLQLPVTDYRSTYTALRRASDPCLGQWLSPVPLEAHVYHHAMAFRPGTAMALSDFQALVPHARNPRAGPYPLISRVPCLDDEMRAAGVDEYAGWNVTKDGVYPITIQIQPGEVGVRRLARQWPVAELQSDRVTLVGLGSIGSVVAQALAAFGTGTIDLIDPDRFLWHNMIRHMLGPESVGRYKVNAVKETLGDRWPETHFAPHILDAVNDAHELRPLLANSDIVVCAADGIAPRRVVSHLARRASIPAVLACVLDDGAVGEILRLRRGPKFGCLLCQRAALQAQGGMDPEASQELDYGTGNAHKPMTAVGPDLWLIGELTAKIAVSTLLEAKHGYGEHRLPGEHAVISLRTANGLAAPFDLPDTTSIRWGQVPPPRPDCPTCNP